jgi:hypothetical protein
MAAPIGTENAGTMTASSHVCKSAIESPGACQIRASAVCRSSKTTWHSFSSGMTTRMAIAIAAIANAGRRCQIARAATSAAEDGGIAR